MRDETQQPYEPEQDPDTEPPTPPEEVEHEFDRDQAEGDQPDDPAA